MDLSRFVRRDRRILLVSDMHLCPTDRYFADDAPELLHSVLARYPGFSVAILGDFLESLASRGRDLEGFSRSSRLRPLLGVLATRAQTLIIPGNHDSRATSHLQEYFGLGRYRVGPVRIDRLVLLHGHEAVTDASPIAERFGRALVPLGVTLKRAGVPSAALVAPNETIAAQFAGAAFPIFGHTHEPDLRRTYANTGSFLRSSRKTFITVDRGIAKLWELT